MGSSFARSEGTKRSFVRTGRRRLKNLEEKIIMCIRVSILDPVHIYRQGLKSVLEQNKDIQIVNETSKSNEFMHDLKEHASDLGLVNADCECGTNIAFLLRKIQRSGERIPLVFYANWERSKLLGQEAVDADVEGMLSCKDDACEFRRAVVEVAEGRHYRSESVCRLIRCSRSSDQRLRTLTDTEVQILQLLATIKTSREIATEMVISHRTVQKHRDNITHKLQLQGSNALLAYAVDFAGREMTAMESLA